MAIRVKIQVTVPKEILNSADVRRALNAKQRSKTGPEIKAEFRKTTNGWRTKPTWNQKFVSNTREVSVTVQTGTSRAAEIYYMVNEGARPHIIQPINPGGFLRFRTGYTPATRPRVISSQRYKRSGPYRITRLVRHPGFEARKFDEAIADAYMDTFAQDMQDAINSVVP